jgi:uncharacterized phage protein (TIGR01671 family)
MKKLKFRGWDTKKKKMYSAEDMGKDELTLSVNGKGFVNVSGADTRLSQYYTHIIPLQYTGQNDINGKEIYENDIVKLNDGQIAYVGRDFDDNAGFDFYFNGEFSGRTWSGCEVIGNIYENPELTD